MACMNSSRTGFILYCLTVLALAVCAAEFWLMPRLLGLPRAALLTGFVATPGTVVDGQVINRLGFTGDEPALQKPVNTLRVLLLGSSTLFNRHLGEQMKTALQQRTDKNVELLDAGIRSHTTRADVLKWQLLAAYEWDYVVFYDGINDLWANHVLPEDFRSDYAHLDPWYRRTVWLDNSLLLRYSYNLASQLIHALNRKTGEILFPDYQFVFPKKPFVNAANFASMAAYRANVDALLASIRNTNARPVLLTFAYHLPENYSRQAFMDNTLDYSNPDNYDKRDVFNWGPPEYVRNGLQQQNAIVRELALQHQVQLIDVDAQMSHHGAWFGDVCHFNTAGVDVFVNAVAEALLPTVENASVQK